MRVLGIDFGTKRIGIAIGGTETNVAIPRETIAASGAVSGIAALCKKERIERIIVGLPLTLAGEEGAMANEVRAFGKKLEKESGVPIEFIDERLSTKGLPQEGVGSQDAAAAAMILQTWFDRQNAEETRNKVQ